MLKVLSLFDGISCGQLALQKLGYNETNMVYYASEIDKHAIKVTQHNFPNTIQLGDINCWMNWDIDWRNVDLVLAGSPCQGFSIAGKQLNFNDDRSKLFYEFVNIMNAIKAVNNNIIYLLENNKMKKEYENTITKILGSSPVQINSKLISAQNRDRLYWSNKSILIPPDLNIHLSSIVGDYIGIWVYPRGYNKGGVQGYNNKCPTITTSSWQHNFKICLDEKGNLRDFTPEECEQIQTLPIGYTDVLSSNQRIKAIGNGWTVDVIVHILRQLLTI